MSHGAGVLGAAPDSGASSEKDLGVGGHHGGGDDRQPGGVHPQIAVEMATVRVYPLRSP